MATATPTPEPPKETLKKRISEFLRDVVSLDVLTLTGEVTLSDPKFDPADKKFSWDTVMTDIAAKMKVSDDSRLEVVAYTHAEWDFDSVNFVRKDLKPEHESLRTAHEAAVTAAHASRLEALKTLASLIP